MEEVVAVREIDERQIEPSPSIGNSYSSEFITDLVKINDHFIMILDLIKLFTTDELKSFLKI